MCATAEPGRFQCGPARPGEGSSAARSARRSFPKEFIPDFSREILEKNPVILEKNPVSLYVLGLSPSILAIEKRLRIVHRWDTFHPFASTAVRRKQGCTFELHQSTWNEPHVYRFATSRSNPDAQNVPSFRRWRFEMKLSPFFFFFSCDLDCHMTYFYLSYTCHIPVI